MDQMRYNTRCLLAIALAVAGGMLATSCSKAPVPVDDIAPGKRSEVFEGSMSNVFKSGKRAIWSEGFDILLSDQEIGVIVFNEKNQYSSPRYFPAYSPPINESGGEFIPGATVAPTKRPVEQRGGEPLEEEVQNFLAIKAFAMQLEYLGENTTMVTILSALRKFEPVEVEGEDPPWILGSTVVSIKEDSVEEILKSIRKKYPNPQEDEDDAIGYSNLFYRDPYAFDHAVFLNYRGSSYESAIGAEYRRTVSVDNLIGVNASFSHSTSMQQVVLDGRPDYYYEYEESRLLLTLGADKYIPLTGGLVGHTGIGVGYSLPSGSSSNGWRRWDLPKSDIVYPNQWTPVFRVGLAWRKPGPSQGLAIMAGYQYSNLTPQSSNWLTAALGYVF